MTEEEPHIAVLFCDKPISPISEKYGDLGDLCGQLLSNSGGCKYPPVKYSVFSQIDNGIEDEKVLDKVYLDLLSKFDKKLIKGVFLSGSVEDAFAQDLWIQRLDEFLRNVVLQIPYFPVVGVCFGHQIICKNLGCKVDRNAGDVGWECGISTINLNPEIFSIKDSKVLDILKDEEIGVINDHLNLPEMHRDIVYGLPNSMDKLRLHQNSKFISIGSSSKCSIQGIITESGPLKVLTFQGHPEFSTEFTLDLLKYSVDNKRIDPHVYEKACYNTKILNNQGPLIGKLITKFIDSLN